MIPPAQLSYLQPILAEYKSRLPDGKDVKDIVAYEKELAAWVQARRDEWANKYIAISAAAGLDVDRLTRVSIYHTQLSRSYACLSLWQMCFAI